MIALGLGLLRLSPRAFWAMTPREMAHVLRGLGDEPAGPPDRRALDALMTMFPDTSQGARP